MMEPMLKEFREEVAITKSVLDRVPADKLSWKPHRKSMSLGALALHLATVPGALARISQLDEFDAAQANFHPPEGEESRRDPRRTRRKRADGGGVRRRHE